MTSKQVERSRTSAEQEPAVGVRTPIDVRSAALTVVAVLAVVLVLKMAQAMIIPIGLGELLGD